MEPSPAQKPKFDPVRLISHALSFVKHARLMLVMTALGIVAGMLYYVYSKPTYMARSLVYVRAFGAPVVNGQVTELRMSGYGIDRTFLTSFTSTANQLRAAQRLGLLGPQATAESVPAIIPAVRYTYVDSNHIELIVYAYDPEVVRTFGAALVDEYKAFQEKTWTKYREEALDRYGREVVRLEGQIETGRNSLLQQERDTNLTEVTITAQSLTDIPRALVESRERLKRMQDIGDKLAQLEAGGSQPGNVDSTLETLSLLSNFEKDTQVSVGNVVRAPTAGARANIAATKATATTDVIVQPGMVEELAPWKELDKERRHLTDQIQEAGKIYLPDHAILKDLNAKLQDVERSLQTELVIARQRFDLETSKMTEKIATLEKRLPEYYAVTEKLDKTSYEYTTLADGQVIWDRARDQLADKLAAITFAEDPDWLDLQFKGHVFLRDEIPVSPNKMKLVMLSVMISLVGAFAAPIALNMMDTTAATVQQVEEYTGVRGIGMVPLARKELLEDIHRSPAQGAQVPNFLLETIRIVRSQICLHPNRDSRSQVVMVTSARPQEGKTSQAANLAWAFQSMGEKTLLLDCDLRRGRVHGFTGIPNEPGMTRLLAGACSPQEAILTVGHPSCSFDVIPRGPVIAGATEILCQKQFDDLIALFRQHYDRIVIDTPPVLGLSETSSLQRVCDGVLLVVRAEKTSKKDVADAANILTRAGAHFFGFVLNAVDLSKASNYYNYYYYSAAYYDDFDDLPEDEPPAGPPPVKKPRPVTVPSGLETDGAASWS